MDYGSVQYSVKDDQILIITWDWREFPLGNVAVQYRAQGEIGSWNVATMGGNSPFHFVLDPKEMNPRTVYNLSITNVIEIQMKVWTETRCYDSPVWRFAYPFVKGDGGQ